MTFKNLLLGLLHDPSLVMMHPTQPGKQLYKVTIDEFESSVSVRVDGDSIILKQTIECEGDEKEKAVEECCEYLFKQIFLRGAMTLNAPHSGTFLPSETPTRETIEGNLKKRIFEVKNMVGGVSHVRSESFEKAIKIFHSHIDGELSERCASWSKEQLAYAETIEKHVVSIKDTGIEKIIE